MIADDEKKQIGQQKPLHQITIIRTEKKGKETNDDIKNLHQEQLTLQGLPLLQGM